MIQINLIPSKLKKAKQMQLVSLAAAGIAVMAVVIMAGIIVMQKNRIANVDKEIRKIDAESASLKDKIEEVKKFNSMEEAYTKKKQIIDKLMVDQSFWPELLDKISELVLPDMWLNSIDQGKEKDEGVELSISGHSLSKVIVADFIKRLEDSSSVMDLKTARIADELNTEGLTLTLFELKFLYKKKK